MRRNWERYLERWLQAGLIDPSAAERVRAYEREREQARGLRWPILLAVAFGGLLLAAGILLFVAAHWDTLSPALRFALVLILVALMHVAGAIAAARFPALATALHAVGTTCLGAGIFMAGQIFHLQEHWPGGVLLWAVGAWVAWALLRDWPQAALAGILTPAWLVGEWSVVTQGWIGSESILAASVLMLAISYLTALLPEKAMTHVRVAFAWIGGLVLIPAVAAVIQADAFGRWRELSLPWSYRLFGWAAALLLPLALAWLFRGRSVWLNVIAAFWVAALSMASIHFPSDYTAVPDSAHALVRYAVCAVGSIGLIAWGMKENRRERVNLGIAGFALTVLLFYFSTVMGMIGRSASLIGLGLLFLLGGWLLEKTRRRLLARMKEDAA